MPDIAKHLDRARQAIERRNYPLAIEVLCEVQEIEAGELELYRLLLDAAKRHAAATGKKGGMSLGFKSKDPFKALSQAVKKVAKSPDAKACAEAGDAARALYDAGTKSAAAVAILFYEEVRSSGLFNADVLWHLGKMQFAVYKEKEDLGALDRAITAMAELQRNMPAHAEAGRTVQQWEAVKSMEGRKARDRQGSDYRSQLSSDKDARRNEIMAKIPRTQPEMEEMVAFIDEDLKANPNDKRLWYKKGDVLKRFALYDRAREAYAKVQSLDQHDFQAVINLGDLAIAEAEDRYRAAQNAGGDLKAATIELLKVRVDEFQKRAERQPTEMNHRFHLGEALYGLGQIDQAAACFQQSKRDAKHKARSLFLLGKCFRRKNLLDIAKDQLTECLALHQDELSDEYKKVLYERADVCEAANDKAQAVKDFRKLVELDLGYKDAADRLRKLMTGA